MDETELEYDQTNYLLQVQAKANQKKSSIFDINVQDSYWKTKKNIHRKKIDYT